MRRFIVTLEDMNGYDDPLEYEVTDALYDAFGGGVYIKVEGFDTDIRLPETKGGLGPLNK